MYTSTVLAVLLAGTALALPNMIPQPRFAHYAQPAPARRQASYSASRYGVALDLAATTTVTILTTVTPSPTTTIFTDPLLTSVSTTAEPTSTDGPIAVPEQHMAGVYICSDVNWGGSCEHKLTPLGSSDEACTQLDGKASSIGPDVGFSCLFFTNSYCRQLATNGSDILGLTYPGNSNLLITEFGSFNDKIYSYQCFPFDPTAPGPELTVPPPRI